MNELERKAGLPATPGYAYARKVGSQLHVAGQVPCDSAGNIVGKDDAYEQVRQCLANLALVLGCHGFKLEDVQHLTVYVVGGREAHSDAWRSVREQFADDVPPASLIGVTMLGYDEQVVEIDATVIKQSIENS